MTTNTPNSPDNRLSNAELSHESRHHFEDTVPRVSDGNFATLQRAYEDSQATLVQINPVIGYQVATIANEMVQGGLSGCIVVAITPTSHEKFMRERATRPMVYKKSLDVVPPRTKAAASISCVFSIETYQSDATQARTAVVRPYLVWQPALGESGVARQYLLKGAEYEACMIHPQAYVEKFV